MFATERTQELPVREVAMLSFTVIHCNVAVCVMTVIVYYNMLAVMRSRSWSVMMCCGHVHMGIV